MLILSLITAKRRQDRAGQFSALIYRNCIDNKIRLRHLPSLNQHGGIPGPPHADAWRSNHTRRRFLVPQSRRATKDNHLTHTMKTQSKLQLRRIQLFRQR